MSGICEFISDSNLRTLCQLHQTTSAAVRAIREQVVVEVIVTTSVKGMREVGVQLIENGPRFKLTLGDFIGVDEDLPPVPVNNFQTVTTVYIPEAEIIVSTLGEGDDATLLVLGGYSTTGVFTPGLNAAGIVQILNGEQIQTFSEYGTVYSITK